MDFDANPTRRKLLIATLVAPIARAYAGSVSSPPPATQTGIPQPGGPPVTSEGRSLLAQLVANITKMKDAQAAAATLAGQYDVLAANRSALEEKITQLDARIEQLKELAAKIDQVSQKIEQLLPQLMAELATDRNANAECAQLGTGLLATGYIDAAQNAAIQRGLYKWTPASMQVARQKGRAHLEQFRRPTNTLPPPVKNPVPKAPGTGMVPAPGPAGT